MINYVLTFYYFLKFKINFYFNYSIDKKFLNLPSSNINLILKVRLSEIKYFLPNKYIKNKNYFFFTKNCFKNKKLLKFYPEYNKNYKSTYQIFFDKINFKKSDEYRNKVSELKKNGVTTRGHKNIDELDKYFNDLFKLYKDMKKNGYLPQQRLSIKQRSNVTGDEIGVFIGPNGEIIKAEDKFKGTHRFALARILKLKYVYINVRAVDLHFAQKKIFKKMSLKDNETKIFDEIKLFLRRYK